MHVQSKKVDGSRKAEYFLLCRAKLFPETIKNTEKKQEFTGKSADLSTICKSVCSAKNSGESLLKPNQMMHLNFQVFLSSERLIHTNRRIGNISFVFSQHHTCNVQSNAFSFSLSPEYNMPRVSRFKVHSYSPCPRTSCDTSYVCCLFVENTPSGA